MLELPPTMRIPRAEELPDDLEIQERFKALQEAQVVEGYTLHENTDEELPFQFYAEINVNNSRLWDVITALFNLLPEEVGVLYNRYREKQAYSPYLEKDEVLSFLIPYQTELCQDCNLEFGVLSHTEEGLEEFFVTESKYVKFWGCSEGSFQELMLELGLKAMDELQHMDEFPKAVDSLTALNPAAKTTVQLIDEWTAFFKTAL
ncbi:MAG TPA: hypothetical protein VNZ86_06000 [Bacteroidia bacterium]|jgi:hypothetical protein|nr:hypothetical protein [Bacteroidia bacterium]